MGSKVLKFLTGNKNKLLEVQNIVNSDSIIILGHEIDLPEIQETNPQAVIRAKLEEADSKGISGIFFVEDTSVLISAYGPKLPGPLIKWFISDEDSLERITTYVNKIGIDESLAMCIIGLSVLGKFYFFEGIIPGRISKEPMGNNGFGWDNIFIPNGSDKTFGQMDLEEKNKYSMRKIALEKMKKFILNKGWE